MSEASLLLRLLHAPVETLGPGRRVGLWVQGCSIGCPGCIAPENQPFDDAWAVPVAHVLERVTACFVALPDLFGVTISGGEPFDQPEALLALLRGLRAAGLRDVLVYSGYPGEDLRARFPEHLALLAALVDGPFVQGALTDAGWKGSDNQRLWLFDDALAERYGRWRCQPKGRLQLVRGETEYVLVGIPKQEDVPRIREHVRKIADGE